MIKLAALFSVLYFLISFYFTNNSLINQTILGGYSFNYKFSLLSGLLLGLPVALTFLNFSLLLIISILTGFNLALVLNRVRSSGLNLMIGGGSILGTTSAGCASCGLPVLGVLGLSGSITHLPFHGLELSFLAIGLLLVSTIVLRRKVVCKI